MTATLAGRSGKILSRFPTFMQAPTPGKALASVASALGDDMDEGERILMHIQRSHRLGAAEEARDVASLGSLCDLHPADFFILERLWAKGYLVPDATSPPVSDQARWEQAYAAFVDRLRTSVGRSVSLSFEGCGTIWALLEATAIALDADRVDPSLLTMSPPGVPRDARGVAHLDDGYVHGGFVHSLRVQYRYLTGDKKAARRTGDLFLVENPLTDHQTPDDDHHQRDMFRVRRGGFFDGQVAVQVTGVGARTVRPMVINETDHEGFLFEGVVADGQKLVYTTDGKVLLDGVDVTARASFFRGGMFGIGGPRDSCFDPRPVPAPVASDDAAVVVTPPGGLDRTVPRTPAAGLAQLPALDLRLGESLWRFSVEEGAYDASAFDAAVYEFPSSQADIDALAPSAKVQLSWKENEPFAASVLIPADLKGLESAIVEPGEDLPSLVLAGLERYRAGGIRLDVSYFDEQWVLGHSVLKSLDSPPGPGVSFGGTVPGLPPASPPASTP